MLAAVQLELTCEEAISNVVVFFMRKSGVGCRFRERRCLIVGRENSVGRRRRENRWRFTVVWEREDALSLGERMALAGEKIVGC